MGGWLDGGVKAYVGVTRCGKTTLAIKHQREDAARTRFPTVILDLGAARSFDGFPRASCADEVLYDLYVRRTHAKVWRPSGPEERSKFWKTLKQYGAAHVLVDEIKHIANHDHIEKDFVDAVTVWGHGEWGPTTYYVTAQRPTFIHRDLWAAFDRMYAFRLAKGADAERMKREFGLDPERMTTLGRGEHEPISLGFEDDGADAPPAAGAPQGGDAPPAQGTGDGNAPPAR